MAEAKRGDANEACLAALDRAVDEAVAALSPLHQTVVRKNVELVELLLVRGAKPGTGAGRGMELRDPLLVASVRGGMATSVALLLRHGANVRCAF